MKNNKVTIIRALFSILVGILLVMFPTDTTKLLVVLIGLMFFVPGLISIVSAFVHPKDKNGEIANTKTFPIIGIGSSILGLVLMLIPNVFISALIYILGTSLVVAGVYQIVEYRACTKIVRTPMFLYIVPILITLSGVFILFNPIESASLPFLILGISSIVYGISEFVKAFRLRKTYTKPSQQIAIVEEIETESLSENDFDVISDEQKKS